jgi:hypothetical protein
VGIALNWLCASHQLSIIAVYDRRLVNIHRKAWVRQTTAENPISWENSRVYPCWQIKGISPASKEIESSAFQGTLQLTQKAHDQKEGHRMANFRFSHSSMAK